MLPINAVSMKPFRTLCTSFGLMFLVFLWCILLCIENVMFSLMTSSSDFNLNRVEMATNPIDHFSLRNSRPTNVLSDQHSPKQHKFQASGWFHDHESCHTTDSDGGETLTDLLENIPLGREIFPQWLRELCPEVVDHFEMFPAFARSTVENTSSHMLQHMLHLPLLTTEDAAVGVCTIKIAQKIASRIGGLALHAGSQLAALYHGSPFPWDDDFDAGISFRSRQSFLHNCKESENITKGVTLNCYRFQKGIKVWLEGPTTPSEEERHRYGAYQGKPHPPYHGFVVLDIFFIAKNKTHVFEIYSWDKNGRSSTREWPVKRSDYFPMKNYYFGGIKVMGSSRTASISTYGKPGCYLSDFDHHLQRKLPINEINDTQKDDRQLDCCRMAKRFPFLYESKGHPRKIYNGQHCIALNKEGKDDLVSDCWE